MPHLHSLVVDMSRLVVWLALLAVIFVPLERWFALHDTRLAPRRLWGDIAYYFLSSLLPGVLLAIPVALMASATHALMPASALALTAALPFTIKAALAFAVGEVGAYWGHRWSHEIPVLWRFHAIHHAPEHIDFLVNTRVHPVDMVFTRLCALLPITALGLGGPSGTAGGTLVPVLVVLLGTVWGFFIHANLRWRFGPLEWLVATPAFHHWHHVRSGPINRNYAATLPVLDRLFGTLHLPRHWPDRYGTTGPAPQGGLVQELVQPFRPSPPTQERAAERAPERTPERTTGRAPA